MTTTSLFRRLAALLACACATALPLPTHASDDSAFGLSWFGGGQRVTGSGKLATEARAVSGFQAVSVRAAVKLVLRQGSREGIELRADDNLLPLIETVVVDRSGVPTLEITLKKNARVSSQQPIVATVDLVTLRALSIRGSGDVVGDALKTSALVVAISGSGNVKLRQLTAEEVSAKVAGSGDIQFGGRVTKLGVSISGSGDVDAGALDADDVSISIAGSGDASVTARKTLNVSIAGVGNVRYTGDAVVKTSIAGNGNVSKR